MFTQAIKETVADIDFKCKILNTEDEVNNLVSDIKTKRFAINTYSDKSEIFGFSISTGNDDNYFVPAKYIEKIKPLLEEEAVKKVFYDAKRNYYILKENGSA